MIWGGEVDDWQEGDHLDRAAARAGLDPGELFEASTPSRARSRGSSSRTRSPSAPPATGACRMIAFDGEPFFGQDRFDQLIWRHAQQGLGERRGCGRDHCSHERGQIGQHPGGLQPWWPPTPAPPPGAPNILVVLFDDVGFSDFGCYGSPIETPTIDALAADGLRYHRLPHHRHVLDHAGGAAHRAQPPFGGRRLPGQFRFRLSRLSRQDRPRGRHPGRDAARRRLPQLHARQVACDLADRDRADRARSTAGRWAAASTASTASWTPRPTSSRRNWCATTPRSSRPSGYADGYHLTEDLTDQAIRFIADHTADAPDTPWLTWLAFGACHAPHQAPRELIIEVRRGLRRRLGRRARAAAGAAEGAGRRAGRHPPAAAQRLRPALGRAFRRRAAAVHPAAGRLRRHARPRRPRTSPGWSPSSTRRACATTP